MSPSFQFGAKNESLHGARHGNWLVVRRVSPGTVIFVLFLPKYAVPRQSKPGILKLTIRRGQSNFSIAFIFVSFEEGGYYRVVSAGQLSSDSLSYDCRSRRMHDWPSTLKRGEGWGQ